MGGLCGNNQELCDIALAGGEIFEEMGVEAEDGELVQSDETGDELEDEQLQIDGELAVVAGEMLGEEELGEALGIVEEVEGGEVERVGLVLVLLFLLGRLALGLEVRVGGRAFLICAWAFSSFLCLVLPRVLLMCS